MQCNKLGVVAKWMHFLWAYVHGAESLSWMKEQIYFGMGRHNELSTGRRNGDSVTDVS